MSSKEVAAVRAAWDAVDRTKYNFDQVRRSITYASRILDAYREFETALSFLRDTIRALPDEPDTSDGDRMDWLESQLRTEGVLGISINSHGSGRCSLRRDGSSLPERSMKYTERPMSSSLRECIDAAIAAGKDRDDK